MNELKLIIDGASNEDTPAVLSAEASGGKKDQETNALETGEDAPSKDAQTDSAEMGNTE